MSDFQEMIEKIAMGDKSFKDWESNIPPNIKRERELIKRVQEFDDKMAMKELIRLFRITINQLVQSSSVGSVMDQGRAQQQAIGIFKDIIKKNFNLREQVKPDTYIRKVLPRYLHKQRLEYTDMTARKSKELTDKSGYMAIATGFLTRQHDREPTNAEVEDFIKNKLKFKINTKNIERANQLSRKEYSGDQQAGSGDTSAEHLTWMDIHNVDDITPEDMYEKSIQVQRIEDELQGYTRPERKLIRHHFGIGEFEGRRAKNINQLSVNNNMTNYEAKKIIDKIKQSLKEKYT